jgi:hypothetical protein
MAAAKGKGEGEEGAAITRAPFVNRLAVQCDISEVALSFSQEGSASGEEAPRLTVATSPVHLVSFSRVLSQTVANYERDYGRIPDLPAPYSKARGH